MRAHASKHRRKTALRMTIATIALFLGSGPQAQVKHPPKAETPNATAPLPRGKKLLLKDGTYQLVRSYQVQGDRVRFYSVERSQWEEIPASLVDWDATRRAEAEETQQDKALVAKVKAAEAAEKAAPVDVDASIEVAPGVFLPPGEGAYVLDGRTVLPLEQAEAGMRLDRGRMLEQVLVPIPIVPSRHNVEISGKRSRLRISSPSPEFYMRTGDAQEPQLELIRAQIHGDARRIESLDVLFKQQSAKRDSLPLQLWPLAKGVYRLTLGQPLEAGEYVLAENVPGEGINFYVWDFGVDAPRAQPAQEPK